MGMQLSNRPARYALAAGVATVLAIGTAGLVAVASAAASPASQAGWKHCSTSITKQRFGTANFRDLYAGNLPVSRYTLANCRGMQVKILTYGGIVQSIQVPGRGGRLTDVVLGFKTLQDYVNLDSPAVTANRRAVLRRDHRPVRQPDRQGTFNWTARPTRCRSTTA